MVARASLLPGLAWLGLTVLSWGPVYSVAKRTLPVLDAFFLSSIRYALGVLLFIVILWATEGRKALGYGGRFLPAAVFGLIGFCGFNILVWWGLTYTLPEHAAIIMALQTPMTALAMWLLHGLRPAPFAIGCIVSAICGVLLVVTKGDLAVVRGVAEAGATLWGDLLVLLGALSWVVYATAGTQFTGWSPLRMTVLTAIPGTCGLVVINALTISMGWSELPGLGQLLSVKWELAYFVLFTVVLGVLGFNNGVKHLGALNAMLMLNLVPVLVFGIEAWLGRSFAAVEIGGAAVVIAALVANNLYLRRQVARHG